MNLFTPPIHDIGTAVRRPVRPGNSGSNRLPPFRVSAALYILAVCLASPALARSKTDVLVMNNGDRITCEVKNLQSGILSVDLDYVDGTLSVDWRKVTRLESQALFLVQMQDGSIYSGRIVTPEALPGTPVKLEVQPDDRDPLVVDRSSVVRVTQFSESFWRRFSGKISLGASYAKGNNTTQYNFGSELDYIETRWGANLDYNSNLASSTGAPVSTRNQLDLSAYRLMRWNQYFYTAGAGFLQSSVQEIDRQTIFALGAGRYLKNTNRIRWTVQGGIGWVSTTYGPSFEAQRLQNLAVAPLGTNLNLFIFKKTNLTLTASAMPALNQQGRVLSRVNATYYLKVFGKIDWNLSFYGNWDNQPPLHLPSADYGTSAGLSYSFGNK